jgi:hypothetical protein
MNKHPYVRAYMAGAVVPTLFMLVVITLFVAVRYVCAVPVPVERVIIFPMAFVPNLFGLWNMFYLWLRPRPHLPIGCHGALLPFLLVPLGAMGAIAGGFLEVGGEGIRWFQLPLVSWAFAAPAFACALIVYYLAWKYLVGFFNRVVEIA